MSGRARTRVLLEWLADWQIVPVGLLVPVFVFGSNWFPFWLLAVLLLCVGLLWLAYWLARGRLFTRTPADLAILAWAITLPVGLWASPVPEASRPYLLQELVAIALFYALVNSLNTGPKVKLAAGGVMVGTALLAGVTLVGMKSATELPFLPSGVAKVIPHTPLSFWNPASQGFNANIMGGVLAALLPVTVAYAWSALARPRSLRQAARAALLWSLVIGAVLVMVAAQSRGSLLGFGAGLAVVAVGRDRRWGWALALALVALVGGIVMYGLQPSVEVVLGSVGENAITSAEGRLEIASRGLNLLQDFPFTGIGLGMFPRIVRVSYPLFLLGSEAGPAHVHNLYLQAGVEHGLPGLIAFLALLMLLLVMGWQGVVLSRGRSWEPLALGLLAGLVAMLVHGLVDVVGSSPRTQILIWSQWGLLAAVWHWAQTQQGKRGA